MSSSTGWASLSKRKSSLSAIITTGLLLVAVGSSILVFNRTMVSYDHNESMYVTAGVLSSQGYRPYLDFAYLQTPYLPLFYAPLFRLLQPTDYLSAAKVVTFGFYIGSALLLALSARRLAVDRLTSLGLTLLFLLNPLLIRVVQESSNYVAPIFLTYLAFFCFLHAMATLHQSGFNSRHRHVRLMLFASGLCLALSVGTKLYHGLLIPPFLLVLLTIPHQGLARRQGINLLFVPAVAGLVAGFLPLIGYLLVDAEGTWFNNLGYHMANTTWLWEQGGASRMTFPSKLEYVGVHARLPEISVLLIMLIALVPLTIFERQSAGRRNTNWYQNAWLVYLAAGLLIASIPVLFIPTPVYKQYYAIVVSIFLLLIVVLLASISPARIHLRQGITVLAVLGTLWWALPPLRADLGTRWVTQELRAAAAELALHMPDASGREAKVATIVPILPLHAGYAIYPELATGPFLYRVGDLLSAQARARYHATSPATVEQLLTQQPPAAILLSNPDSPFAERRYTDLEQPFRRFAEQAGYRQVAWDWAGGILYVRAPSSPTATTPHR